MRSTTAFIRIDPDPMDECDRTISDLSVEFRGLAITNARENAILFVDSADELFKNNEINYRIHPD